MNRAEKLYIVLTHIINRCENNQPIPEKWKVAYKIKSPIKKKREENNSYKYRGMSIIIAMRRLYGRVLHLQSKTKHRKKKWEHIKCSLTFRKLTTLS